MEKKNDGGPAECWNGCYLDPEQAENPMRSADGTVWCDDCFKRLFTFDCAACDNYEHEDNQHRYLVVNDEEEAGILPGVYRIIDKPYALVSILGPGSLSANCLLRVGDLPIRVNIDGYPWGHLCTSCSEPYETIMPDRPCIIPSLSTP